MSPSGLSLSSFSMMPRMALMDLFESASPRSPAGRTVSVAACASALCWPDLVTGSPHRFISDCTCSLSSSSRRTISS
ncbi:Uncharacterised protein [Mycobacteroides abscessus subsp. abscessus]|nr:Uncharacterised protein [Mycobacteroides abscessus subsp. abscessus]SKU52693.1 Uncharacterised protein [Mycobacteroides abscessus subsp. abscessus]